MALEDGSGKAALGGGVEHRVLDCSGGVGRWGLQKNTWQWHWNWHRRQHCQSWGLTIMALVSALARMAREDASDARDKCQWQLQGDRGILVAVMVAAVQMQRWCQKGKGKGTMAWRQMGTGEARAMQRWHHQRGDGGGGKRLGQGARPWLMQSGQKGCDGSAALKYYGKICTRLNTILLLTPPQESTQTKHRWSCLRPLDEVL